MRRSPACFAAIFALVLAAGVQGEMITFAFSGTITSVSQSSAKPIGDVKVNDPFHGTYTFDSQSPDLKLESGRGEYNSPDGGLSITLGGGATLAIPGPNMSIFVSDEVAIGGSPYDSYAVGALGVSSEGWSIPEFVLGMTLIHSAFNSEALPLVPPPPDLFVSGSIHFSGSKAGVGDFGIHGTFESLVLVPEPCSLLLLGCGAVLVFKNLWRFSRRTGVR